MPIEQLVMIKWIKKLAILLILQTISLAETAVPCGVRRCCVVVSSNRCYVIDCREHKPRIVGYIQYENSEISVFCSSENENDSDMRELIGSRCTRGFDNCVYPDKLFNDIIRTVSTNINVTIVSLTLDRMCYSYTMGHQLYHLPELKTLDLYQGRFTHLSEDMLQYVPGLENLNLSSNSITGMEFRFFRYATRLKRVDLSFNQISYINLSLFRDVPDLRFLSLKSNKLTDLNEEMFVRLVRLEHLDIGKNELKTLPAKLFGTLWSLRKLSMSENEFSSLPSDLLTNNNNLEECYLSNNHGSLTSLPEAMFGNLSYLKILGLGGNRLVELQENSFWGSYNLTKLDLSGNDLAKLPEHIFHDAKNLLELNLSHNTMDSIPDGLLENQNKLTHFHMRYNRLTTISRSMFFHLTSLIELDLESNRIHHLQMDCFRSLSNLRIARLFNNSIESPINGVETLWSFASCKNLEALYLYRNKISTTSFEWISELNSLRTLDLESNFVPSLKGLLNTTLAIEEKTTQYRYIRFNFINNNITRIPLCWRKSRYYSNRLSVELSVAENPLDCGCNVYNLLTYLAESLRFRFYDGYRIILGTLACNEPARMKGKQVTQLSARTFSCPVESNTKNPVLCVKTCDCLWRPSDDVALIDCAGRLKGRVPDSFIGSRGRTIELNLIGNRLKKVPLSDTIVFRSITKLFLSHNLISSISSIDIPPKIEVLHLDHNRLKTWDARTLRDIESSRTLKELALKDNPWRCDRNTERSLALMKRKFAELVTYTSDSRCIDGRHITQAKKLPRLYIAYTSF